MSTAKYSGSELEKFQVWLASRPDHGPVVYVPRAQFDALCAECPHGLRFVSTAGPTHNLAMAGFCVAPEPEKEAK